VQHVRSRSPAARARRRSTRLERDDIGGLSAIDDTERTVLRFATEVVRDVARLAGDVRRARAPVTTQEVVELVITVGYYMLIARCSRRPASISIRRRARRSSTRRAEASRAVVMSR
jgi:alkylhydroperoxidase family enzyme